MERTLQETKEDSETQQHGINDYWYFIQTAVVFDA